MLGNATLENRLFAKSVFRETELLRIQDVGNCNFGEIELLQSTNFEFAFVWNNTWAARRLGPRLVPPTSYGTATVEQRLGGRLGPRLVPPTSYSTATVEQ